MLFKLGWDRVEGTYIDSKFVERKWEAGSEMWFEINDYLVEVVLMSRERIPYIASFSRK